MVYEGIRKGGIGGDLRYCMVGPTFSEPKASTLDSNSVRCHALSKRASPSTREEEETSRAYWCRPTTFSTGGYPRNQSTLTYRKECGG